MLVRAGDGVHLTPDGGDVIAQAVYEHLEPLCRTRTTGGAGRGEGDRRGEGQLADPGTRRTDVPTRRRRRTARDDRRHHRHLERRHDDAADGHVGTAISRPGHPDGRR